MSSSISNLVADFETVAIAPGLVCPSCGAPFTPHALRAAQSS
jgi:hypothetical protein